jgi:rubrerythrin
MNVDISSLSFEKALSLAIKSEGESAEVYKKLKNAVNNFVLRDKLQFLINEEKKHKKILENLYEKMFPESQPGKVDRALLPRLSIALKEESNVIDLLELAMEAEKTAEEFYENLSEEVEMRGVQEILLYLSSMELGHYALLKGEYDLCMRDEGYYERGDFQYDMVHIGP